jgi:mxaD protein
MKLKYKIIEMSTLETLEFAGRQVDKKPLPVNTYSSTMQVEPSANGSKITWKGKFYRAYLLNPPVPEGMSDEDAVKTMTSVYQGGLENLKTILEQK